MAASMPPRMMHSVSAMGLPGVHEPHPYDMAHGMIKRLRADLEDLRSSLHMEQQQRATEVTELKNEVMSLREMLSREVMERRAVCHTFATDLTTEVSARVTDLNELRAKTRQNISQLNEILQDEMRDRKATDSLRDTRELAAETERKQECNSLRSSIDNNKAVLLSTKDDHATKLNQANHDMQALVTYLKQSSSSWNTLSPAKMLSNKAHISPQSPSNTILPQDKLGYHMKPITA